jgi:hypothetical protein
LDRGEEQQQKLIHIQGYTTLVADSFAFYIGTTFNEMKISTSQSIIDNGTQMGLGL